MSYIPAASLLGDRPRFIWGGAFLGNPCLTWGKRA
jgi:hypothetical protein